MSGARGVQRRALRGAFLAWLFRRRRRSHASRFAWGLALVLWVPCARAADAAPVAAATWQHALTGGRVLILGDSITQAGGYVSFLEYYLWSVRPAVPHDVISIGLSSETLSGLSEQSHPFPRPSVLERVDRALKAVKPQTVFACYGMNDGIYHPSSPERLAAFRTGLQQLVRQVLATGARLVIVTPPVFDARSIPARTVAATAPEFGYATPFIDYDHVLAEFAGIERTLHDDKVIVVDLHEAMSAELASRRASDPKFTFAPDGVHPGDLGHLFIARTIMNGLGVDRPSRALDDELSRILADPRFPLITERRQLRSEAWLPFVGYQRGAAFKSDFVTGAEKVAARLQSQIDAMESPAVHTP